MPRNVAAADEILGVYFPVLDNGFISLVDYMGTDEDIVNAARTSYASGTKKVSDDRGLIRRLMRDKHCYHPEMEVLTIQGWKAWKDCSSEEYFAVPNIDTKTFKFEKLSLLSFDYEGEMFNFSNDRLSYSVTPNHRMYFKHKYAKNPKFEVVEASKMNHWGHFLGIQDFSMSFDDNGTELNLNQGRFVGFFLGDGYWSSTNMIGFRLQKPRKIEYLQELLNNLDIQYKLRISVEGSDTVHTYTMDIPHFLPMYTDIGLKCDTKNIKLNFDIINKRFIEGCYDGLVNSDGSKKKDRKQIEFGTTSKNLSDNFQLLSILLGMDSHRVKSCEKSGSRLSYPCKTYIDGLKTIESRKQFHSQSQYNGKVYCATSSTGFLMVRGSDSKFGFICGNSSPFEFVELKFHVRAPLYVIQQWLRHRTSNFCQESHRYSEIKDDFQKTSPDAWRLQSKDNKQGSGGFLPVRTVEQGDWNGEDLSMAENYLHEHLKEGYRTRIRRGVAREQARKDIPHSTYSSLYIKSDLHNLLHFLRLRTAPDAQLEIREYSNLIAGMVKRVCPIAFDAWIDYAYAAKSFSRLDSLFLNYMHRNYSVNNNHLQGTSLENWEFTYKGTEDKYHEQLGMTKAELADFWNKILPLSIPNFDLDLSKGKTAVA